MENKQHIHFDNICCSSYYLIKKGNHLKHPITDPHIYRKDRWMHCICLASLNEVMFANEMSIFRQIFELLIADLMPLPGFQLHHLREITGFLQKHN